MHADKIVVMENGRIVETGTHQELIQKQGAYEHLYSIQKFINCLNHTIKYLGDEKHHLYYN